MPMARGLLAATILMLAAGTCSIRGADPAVAETPPDAQPVQVIPWLDGFSTGLRLGLPGDDGLGFLLAGDPGLLALTGGEPSTVWSLDGGHALEIRLLGLDGPRGSAAYHGGNPGNNPDPYAHWGVPGGGPAPCYTLYGYARGAELNVVHRVTPSLSWLWGGRCLRVTERTELLVAEGLLPGSSDAGRAVYWAENDMLGMQFGGCLVYPIGGRLSAQFTGKAGILANTASCRLEPVTRDGAGRWSLNGAALLAADAVLIYTPRPELSMRASCNVLWLTGLTGPEYDGLRLDGEGWMRLCRFAVDVSYRW